MQRRKCRCRRHRHHHGLLPFIVYSISGVGSIYIDVHVCVYLKKRLHNFVATVGSCCLQVFQHLQEKNRAAASHIARFNSATQAIAARHYYGAAK